MIRQAGLNELDDAIQLDIALVVVGIADTGKAGQIFLGGQHIELIAPAPLAALSVIETCLEGSRFDTAGCQQVNNLLSELPGVCIKRLSLRLREDRRHEFTLTLAIVSACRIGAVISAPKSPASMRLAQTQAHTISTQVFRKPHPPFGLPEPPSS